MVKYGKIGKDMKEILPEFQTFLLERRLAPEKNIPFLAYWVIDFCLFNLSCPCP